MKAFRSFVAFLFIMMLAMPALADGFIIVPRPPHPIPIPPPHPPHPPHPPIHWHPTPPRVYHFAPLKVEQHHVTVTIKGQIAVTEVDQIFSNPNNVRLEGEYIFPLPKGAQIDKFSMDIDGKQQEAELLDADKARKIYTDIVRSMKDPALMEYADRGMFKVRIFPIEPDGKKQVKVKYTQVLSSDANLVGYTYPLSTEKFSAAPIPSVAITCTIDTKESIKTVYSPSHKVEVTRKGQTQATIGWETKNTKPDSDFQVFFSTQPPARGEIGINLLTHRDTAGSDKDADGHFMLFISPGNVADKQIAKKDIVFVLDTSGSMAGEKLEQAKRAMKFCIANLNNGDRFEIVRFSTEAEPLFDGLREANDDHRAKANQFVQSLRPLGGTAIEDALKSAASIAKAGKKDSRPIMIIFLTDGRPTIGNTNEDQLVEAVQKEIGDHTIRIFSFGIGTDINTHLLDRITQHTKAASQYVLPDEDIEVKVSSFFTKINYPVLSNVELKVKGDVRLTKMYPSPLPDVFRGEQLIIMGRYSGKEGKDGADAALQLTGTIDGKKKTFTYEATFPAKSKDNDFVPRLWATRRVGFLLDQIRLSSADSEVRDEITRLAKQYGIVTPYTSYLILEDDAKRGQDRPRISHAPPGTTPSPEADRALRAEAGAAFDEFRTKTDGTAAVGGAKAAESLKQAQSGEALADADLATRRGIANAPGGNSSVFGRTYGDAGGAGGGAAIHVSKYIDGRTFYFNGSAWIDAQAQTATDAKKVKIEFGSDEYFDLLAKHKDAGAWFALGNNLVVLLDGVVYEIGS